MQFLKLDFIVSSIRKLMAMFCQFLYPLISNLYSLFVNISKVNILSSDQLKPIYQRVTLILTIVMVFYVTFEAVKYVVQPDALTDKEKGAGSVVYKMVIVVVLIAFVPTIFELSYKVQSIIIDQNVIGKVILGTKTDAEPGKLGAAFSSSLLNIGYSVEEDKTDEDCGELKCGTLVSMNLGTLQKTNQLPYLTMGLDASVKETTPTANKDKVEVPAINFEFHGFLSVLLGAFVAYMLILYCVDVGVRWAQLIYLQVISPIPIIGYLSPKKDGIFQKWVKQCTVTYLDLFLRTAIIYVVLLLSSLLLDAYHNPGSNDLLANVDQNLKTWVFLFLVAGVMLFAHKAPKMLAELFPKSGAASGNFGLSMKDRGLDKALKGATRVFGGAAGAAAGAVAGAASGIAQGYRRANSLNKNGKKKGVGAGILGAAQGLVRGTVGGAGRGLVNGAKKGNVLKNATAGAKNQIKSNQRFGNRQENGYGIVDQVGDRVKSAVGARSRVEMQENKKTPIKEQIDTLEKVRKTNDNMRERAEKKLREGKGAKSQDFLTAEKRVDDFKNNQNVRDQYKASKYKTDAEAYDAYIDAVKDARLSVNKQNFIDPTTGRFNDSAYQAACDRAATKVNQDDFKTTPYATEADAQAAFERDYHDAVENLRKIKDAAVEDYIDNTSDPAIDSMRETMKAEIEAYNKQAKADDRIDIATIPSDAHAFDDYAKGTIKPKEDALSREIINIDAEIERIKNQQAGSGIDEGKK